MKVAGELEILGFKGRGGQNWGSEGRLKRMYLRGSSEADGEEEAREEVPL